MIKASEFGDIFPAAPAHRGHGAPVYFEPMIGSGERLTVILAAQDESGQALMEYAISPEKVAQFFGEKGKNVKDMIHWAAHDLMGYLETGDPPPFWQPPLQGFYIGRWSEWSYDEPAEIFRQMKQFYSAFSCLDCSMPVGTMGTDCPAHDQKVGSES